MKFKLYILFFLLSYSLFSQKVTTSIDSTKKKIGAEFKLTLKTETDTAVKVKFPDAKIFGALEVIQSYKIDTIKNGNRYELIKKYGLTQFDSGKYNIPSLPVLINGNPFYSDSIKIEVQDVKVDTLKQKMYDIKDISKAETSFSWWIYVLIYLLLLATGYLIYKYIKKRNSTVKTEEIVFKTPIEKATTLLQQLETKELWQKGEVKSYYSELTDIVRTYIEEEINIPAMESTTSELILNLRKTAKQKKLKLSQETLQNLEKVLQQADLVKFAKVKPLDYEIEEDKKRISSSIVVIHNSIPVIVEKDDELAIWNEQQKEKARLEKIKKEKRAKTIKITAFFVGIVSLSLFALLYIKGINYVKDAVFGNPTKELLESKWVISEYGNPGIKLETPKVLKRMNTSNQLSKANKATIKSLQTFTYGNVYDSFYVFLNTTTLKESPQTDLDKSVEDFIKGLEQQGATTVIVKTEDFDTQKGISGKKAYGTLTMINDAKGKSEKMYYELLIFAQDGGLQQILIMHKDGDDFGNQVAERILNSVELKQAEK